METASDKEPHSTYPRAGVVFTEAGNWVGGSAEASQRSLSTVVAVAIAALTTGGEAMISGDFVP